MTVEGEPVVNILKRFQNLIFYLCILSSSVFCYCLCIFSLYVVFVFGNLVVNILKRFQNLIFCLCILALSVFCFCLCIFSLAIQLWIFSKYLSLNFCSQRHWHPLFHHCCTCCSISWEGMIVLEFLHRFGVFWKWWWSSLKVCWYFTKVW